MRKYCGQPLQIQANLIKYKDMKGKNIIVGITGSIAAYKSCEIIRMLVGNGANVFPVMTSNAAKFVTQLTVQTLARNKVYSDMFSQVSDWEIEHVSLAEKADIVIIAPASADVIAKIACGIADDALTTLVLAVRCPVIVCPAMNSVMYRNPITARNIAGLKALGYIFAGPENGELACGVSDIGRMLSPAGIISEVEKILSVNEK